MHKLIKISLIIIAFIVLAISACIIALNSYSTRIVNNAITEWLKKDKTPTQISVGRIHVGLLNGRVRIYDINLISDTTLLDSLESKHTTKVHAIVGQKGHLDIVYNMHINKECTFDFETKWKNIDMSFINSFVRPLAGITCKNHIDELHSRFSGDKLNAEGEFMMTYHNLEIEVLKDEKAPIEVLKNNAEIVQYITNGLIAHSNPESANQQPKQYKVDGQRNEWLPYPMFLLSLLLMVS